MFGVGDAWIEGGSHPYQNSLSAKLAEPHTQSHTHTHVSQRGRQSPSSVGVHISFCTCVVFTQEHLLRRAKMFYL